MESKMQRKMDPPPKDYPALPPGSNLPSTEVREPTPEFEDAADLRDYLDILLRHKWIVLTVLLVVFTATLVGSLAMKPVFKARASLELNIQAPKVTKFEDVVASQLQTREYMQTQVRLLQSESLAQRVIDRLQLEQNPVFNPAAASETGEEGFLQRARSGVRSLLSFGTGSGEGVEADPAISRMRLERSMLSRYRAGLEVRPERDTSILTLEFSSTDPNAARDILNAKVDEFISWQMDKRIDSASSAKQQLEKQLEISRINLERAEKHLNQYAQRAGIVSLDSNLNLVYKQLEEINKALASTQAERINREALYTQASAGNVSGLSQVLNNTLIQRLREDHIRLAAQYEELSSVYRDEYPQVRNLRAKLNDTERRIALEEHRIFESIRNDFLAVADREERLRTKADTKQQRALELNTRATQYKVLEREVETSKLIHQSLLERSKEIDANVGTELGNIHVVDYAALPLSPFKPNIRLNLLLAIVVGLMGGMGLAFFMEYMDNTVKRVDELTDRFQFTILGVLPLADQHDQPQLDHLVRLKPRSNFSEAVRTSRVSIQLSAFMDNPPKSLVFTSTNAGQGKSTLVCNMAQAFAASEERVVIVDCDLRKPRLHRVFLAGETFNGNDSNGSHAPRRKGLSQFLSGLCKPEEIVHKTEVPGLYFIPAGPIPPNPAELLASNRMRTLMETLSKHFDRVVLDAPPAAGFADVLVLGNYVDGMILVCTLGETHREALRIFRRSMANVKGNLLGCMVNKLDVSHHYGGYYQKYYKYYSYYQQAEYGHQPDTLTFEDPREKVPEKEKTSEGVNRASSV